VADRVIRDRREVDDCVKSLKIVGRHIANILRPLFVAPRLDTEVTSVIPTDIQAGDLMPSGL
jgi:hypothetical protein